MPCQTRLWQVTLRELDRDLIIIDAKDTLVAAFNQTCLNDTSIGFRLSEPMTAFWLVQNSTEGSRLVVRLNHAQYDGVSFPTIISAIFNF